MTTQRHEILFIDANVSDKETIIAVLSSDIETIILDDKTNVLDQIAATLAGYQNLDAIHIISHGAEGELAFANGIVTNSNINSYSSQLKRIGSALSATGDILLYGCDVAKGDDGLAFINTLADLTGSDVAASTDLTGNAALGGDWTLEVITGAIETADVMAADYATVLLASGLTVTPYIQTRHMHSAGEILNHYAFAVIKADGSVVTWGDSRYGGDSSAVVSQIDGVDNSKDVVQIFSAGSAFAALRADGSVVTWGGVWKATAAWWRVRSMAWITAKMYCRFSQLPVLLRR
jgi:hypothetical protein